MHDGAGGSFVINLFINSAMLFPSSMQFHTDIYPSTTAKLLQLFSDSRKKICLWVELAALIDCGERFVKATFELDEDGPLVLEILSTLMAWVHIALYFKLEAVARALMARWVTCILFFSNRCSTVSCVLSLA